METVSKVITYHSYIVTKNVLNMYFDNSYRSIMLTLRNLKSFRVIFWVTGPKQQQHFRSCLTDDDHYDVVRDVDQVLRTEVALVVVECSVRRN